MFDNITPPYKSKLVIDSNPVEQEKHIKFNLYGSMQCFLQTVVERDVREHVKAS